MARTVIAHLPSCDDGECPTLYRDTETGLIGVKGADEPGSTTEHISWMAEADLRVLVGQLPV